MKSKKWMCACTAMMISLSGLAAFAQGQGHGRGHGKGDEHGDHGHGRGNKGGREQRREGYYSTRDRDWARSWYNDHRGTLPPGLMRDVHPVPEEFVRYLPPPPPDCEHVLIGGNIVLLNRRTHLVLDIVALFH